MFYPATGQLIRPNRLERVKDEKYHVEYARWAVGGMSSQAYTYFLQKTFVNWQFYQGNQWHGEDLTQFLLDESGEIRNRIKLTRNIIRPLAHFYKGMASKMAMNGKAEAFSPHAINRRETELARMKFYSKASQDAPQYRDMMEATLPVGRNEDEVEALHSNVFVDEVEEHSNELLTYIKNDIKIDRIKSQLALYLAISGLSVYKGYNYNGTYNGKAINPMFFFWDTNAKEEDLSDAAYMGESNLMDATSILEQWQPSAENAKWIENASRNNSQNIPAYNIFSSIMGNTSANTLVHEVYWNDCEKQEYGWIRDESNYPLFTKINALDSKYKDKDLIEPPEEYVQRYKEKGIVLKKKEKIYVDIVRRCVFIPCEYVGSPKGKDIVLEYGPLEYQDKNSYNISPSKYPYKCGTWSLFNGLVSSPVDDIIDTQRMQNRLLSAAEAIINNAGSSGAIIDKDAASDTQGGEAEIVNAIHRGKTVFVDSKRMGMTNVVGKYDNTVGQGPMKMFDIVDKLQNGNVEITGVNKAMNGTENGSGLLNGVTDTKINQGSIVIEPFFNVVGNVLEDACKDMITVGMKIYADNPRQLAIITGDKGAKIIKITKDMRLEDFRMKIKLEMPDSQAATSTNEQMVALLQIGLIDRDTFVDLYNRGDATMLGRAVRDYSKKLRHAEILKQRNDEVQAKHQEEVRQELLKELERQKKEAKTEERIKQIEEQEARLTEIDHRGMWSIEKTKAQAKFKR